MRLTKLRPEWGLQVDATAEEVFEKGADFWRDIGYKNDLVLFKGLGKISDADYFKICSYFGNPWSKDEYKYTREVTKDLDYNDAPMAITRFSNKLSPRIGTEAMPWHADIPLRGNLSFPWRSLYIISNPDAESGLTSFLNVRLDLINPSEQELAYYESIDLTMHSWLSEGEEICQRNFIKQDPITGKKSLRANCFVIPDHPHLWIRNTFVNGTEVDNKTVLGKIYKELSARDELVYTHKWDLYDLVMYNNWSFIHNRSEVRLTDKNQRREFLRVNIDHVPNANWKSHKLSYKLDSHPGLEYQQ